MAIKISGTTVINNEKQLDTGLDSVYDRIYNTNVNVTLLNRDFVRVTSAGLTLTLPASPVAGNEVAIRVDTTSGGAVITDTSIAGNGQKIMGLDENLVIDIPYAAIKLLYTGSTYGWGIY